MRSLKAMMNLYGRTALITGGAGHIAYASAESLAELGCNIVLVDRSMLLLEEKKLQLLEKYRVRVEAIECDFAEEKNIDELYSQCNSKYKVLDVLLHSAAFVGTTELDGWVTPFEEQSIDTWRKAVEVNLSAIFNLTKLLTPLLKKSSFASIINISSIAGEVGPDLKLYEGTDMGSPAAYAASKGGLIQLTRWLSTVLAPQIRVNSISPGGLFRGQDQKFVDRYCQRTPLGRMGKEEDFKGVVAFLSSSLSEYVTGQNILIDGGYTVW